MFIKNGPRHLKVGKVLSAGAFKFNQTMDNTNLFILHIILCDNLSSYEDLTYKITFPTIRDFTPIGKPNAEMSTRTIVRELNNSLK